MPSLTYTIAKTDNELKGIMELQKQNLPSVLSKEEIASQGFVTVVHSLIDLQKMNAIEQHIICKDEEKVVAYVLAMTTAARNDIPILIPMFDLLETLEYKVKKVSEHAFIIVGQVCVGKDYRGQKVFDQCYSAYRNNFQQRYDFALTEIATRNTRSMQAHARVGFIELHRYTAENGEAWSLVIWPWK
jgi:hypothetical protein